MAPKRTLKEKLVAVHEAHVEEEIAVQIEQRNALHRDSLLMILGGVRAVHSVADALSAQSIRALQRIRDEELYKSEDFKRFDDFLDQSPLSPMGYDKFNRLEKALLNEGDELFDYLNAINAPMSRRRLLGKGTLAIEGEEIVLRQDKEEQRIALDNRAVLLTTLSKLADQTNEQRRTIERGKNEITRLQKQADESQLSTQSARLSTDYTVIAFNALAAMGRLAEATKKLPLTEKLAARESALAPMVAQWDELNRAFGFDLEPPAGHFSDLTAHVTDADLEALSDEM